MIYPKERKDFTKEQVKQLLEEQAKEQGWEEIWAEDGWDDINRNSIVCIISEKPISWTDDLLHWSEDYVNEICQYVFEEKTSVDITKHFYFVKPIWKDGVWLDAN